VEIIEIKIGTSRKTKKEKYFKETHFMLYLFWQKEDLNEIVLRKKKYNFLSIS
jgi:hypothetical protein